MLVRFPKDIQNIIGFYIWQSSICRVNVQYHDTFLSAEYLQYFDYLCTKQKYYIRSRGVWRIAVFNFRELESFQDSIFSTIKIDDVTLWHSNHTTQTITESDAFKIPNYRYTSTLFIEKLRKELNRK